MSSVNAIIDELAARDLLTIASKHAFAHHVTLGEMLGDRRTRAFVWARQALWCELYGLGHFSYPSLGRLFNRDQATIRWGIDAHLNRVGVAA